MAYGYTHDEHIAKITGLENQRDTEALQKAVYLALDATDASKDTDKIKSALGFLQENYGLTKSITYEKMITPNAEHQWYTHLGWEYDYSKTLPTGWTQEWADSQQEIFVLRKEILKDTVKSVFRAFPDGRTESLSALLYYTHIAGDLRYNNSPSNMITIPELACGLDKHLRALFGEKSNALAGQINDSLNGVSFEDGAEPLDRVFDLLFGNVPTLLNK